MPGVHVLRAIGDAEALRGDLLGSPDVVVVGGGFIGCEVASTACSLGCQVTLLHSGPAPLYRVVGSTVGARIGKLHRRHGVRVVQGAAVRCVRGTGRVEHVVLSSGESLPAGVVVLGLGAVPETAWLAGSGVAVDDGVRCDASLRTSVSGVVAAGDVARWPNPRAGGRLQRIEHWTNAAAQGMAAARTLLHGERAAAFSAVPYSGSDQHGTRIQAVGWPERATQPAELSVDGNTLTAEYHRAGAFVGAGVVGDASRLTGYRSRVGDAVDRETPVVAT